MKHYFAAAGALLLGTSTIALAADVKPIEATGVETAKTTTEVKAVDTSDKLRLTASSDVDASGDAKTEFTSLEADLAKLASLETGAKVETVSLGTDPKVQTASFETDKVQTASFDTDAKVETAWADTDAKVEASGTGMGGPLDSEATTTASLTPQPAAQNYPPCDPGPGDDSCIQLYEEGVREQLASWNRPTGGLLDSEAATAMGGPFEPADSAALSTDSETQLASAESASGVGGPFETTDHDAVHLAMSGDGTIDATAGETAATEAASGAVAQAEVTDHSAFTGVGGPVEAQSGYPACEPGPGDDRCIQLYEAGVSGSGN